MDSLRPVEADPEPLAETAVPAPIIPEQTAVLPTQLLNELTKAGMDGPGRLLILARSMEPEAAYIALEQLQETAVAHWNRSQYFAWLRTGNGRLWGIGKDGRLWFYGPSRIAQALGFGRYSGPRMELRPADVTTAKQFRMASYRGAMLRLGQQRIASQATIEAMTGIKPRTQRSYSRTLGIVHRQNFVVTSDEWGQTAVAKHAWNGRHVFKFTDKRGVRGPAGRSYTAYTLPAGHATSETAVGWGRKRKSNRDIDPVLKRRGNGIEIVFHATVSDAAKTWSKAAGKHDVFWNDSRGIKRSARTRTRLLPFAIYGDLPGGNNHVLC